ncbi:unnamed protein product [Polarella glacialis]|uniref:Uncharacterized protein n=1 Tax=Polarella glacialis TaxID=89957 RepID=A0A813J1D6_POLGL|nr:unnamed protein product [Polarella glacialis]
MEHLLSGEEAPAHSWIACWEALLPRDVLPRLLGHLGFSLPAACAICRGLTSAAELDKGICFRPRCALQGHKCVGDVKPMLIIYGHGFFITTLPGSSYCSIVAWRE